MLVLMILGVACVIWTACGIMLVVKDLRRRRRTPVVALRVPSVAETRGSIMRFRQAVARAELVDFVWNRYDRGRGLLR